MHHPWGRVASDLLFICSSFLYYSGSPAWGGTPLHQLDPPTSTINQENNPETASGNSLTLDSQLGNLHGLN